MMQFSLIYLLLDSAMFTGTNKYIYGNVTLQKPFCVYEQFNRFLDELPKTTSGASLILSLSNTYRGEEK